MLQKKKGKKTLK